jgi:hypothetical protein
MTWQTWRTVTVLRSKGNNSGHVGVAGALQLQSTAIHS